MVKEELDWVEDLVKGNESNTDGKSHKTDRNVLEPGTFVNSCKLVSPQNYLDKYMITFDANLKEN